MLHPLLVPCLEAPAPAEIPATIKLVEERNISLLERAIYGRVLDVDQVGFFITFIWTWLTFQHKTQLTQGNPVPLNARLARMLYPLLVPLLEAPAPSPAKIPATIGLVEGRNRALRNKI